MNNEIWVDKRQLRRAMRHKHRSDNDRFDGDKDTVSPYDDKLQPHGDRNAMHHYMNRKQGLSQFRDDKD